MKKRDTTAYSKVWRSARFTSGLCRYCPKPHLENQEACDDCAKHKAKKVLKDYYSLRNCGLCTVCREPSGKYAACANCRAKRNDHRNIVRAETKYLVLTKYSKVETPICYCCDESLIDLLSIDHIDGKGRAHREVVGGGGDRTYKWLIRNNFPVGFRTACHNCNMGASLNNGVCPHEGRIGEIK